MKSILITVLAIICLLSKQCLAFKTVYYLNNDSNGNIVQNENTIEQNNVDIINDTINNKEINDNISLNQDPKISNDNNTPINADNSNNQQQIENSQNHKHSEVIFGAIPVSIPKDDDSNFTAYLLGGVGFTSVAFIAVFGYKNYREVEEFEEINEILFVSDEEEDVIATPEKSKDGNALKRLSESFNLNIDNEDDDDSIIDKPEKTENGNALKRLSKTLSLGFGNKEDDEDSTIIEKPEKSKDGNALKRLSQTLNIAFGNKEDEDSVTSDKTEKSKSGNALKRLSKTLSLGFGNKEDEDFINNLPVVTESVNASNYSLAKNRAYKCHVEWAPLASDELVLSLGDLVCVKESYKDGYSLGYNLYTREDGIFPTCCLALPSENMIGSELVEEGKFVSILKRSTSKRKSKHNKRTSLIHSWGQKNELNSIITE
ncbi:hypothetical protein LY90DRAFT_663352 [Neocallimastix californiae]|jgi:hypothetical protein|uniref:SH3 domain-containing protein n=1 Tax=Neocallimastix californiae TaxID=1754190 RepID=A0A1Y2FT42_9FUNG|nr:hypothetical protein LY90DRAFT_663352 [Neocallimastix californiae]|eukprot:ORY85875.1 hypothetical protein LY90DRAFT_663352 [Neocallimastix californiae]